MARNLFFLHPYDYDEYLIEILEATCATAETSPIAGLPFKAPRIANTVFLAPPEDSTDPKGILRDWLCKPCFERGWMSFTALKHPACTHMMQGQRPIGLKTLSLDHDNRIQVIFWKEGDKPEGGWREVRNVKQGSIHCKHGKKYCDSGDECMFLHSDMEKLFYAVEAGTLSKAICTKFWPCSTSDGNGPLSEEEIRIARSQFVPEEVAPQEWIWDEYIRPFEAKIESMPDNKFDKKQLSENLTKQIKKIFHELSPDGYKSDGDERDFCPWAATVKYFKKHLDPDPEIARRDGMMYLAVLFARRMLAPDAAKKKRKKNSSDSRSDSGPTNDRSPAEWATAYARMAKVLVGTAALAQEEQPEWPSNLANWCMIIIRCSRTMRYGMPLCEDMAHDATSPYNEPRSKSWLVDETELRPATGLDKAIIAASVLLNALNEAKLLRDSLAVDKALRECRQSTASRLIYFQASR